MKVALLSFPNRPDRYGNSETFLEGFEVVRGVYDENNLGQFLREMDGVDAILCRASIVMPPEVVEQLKTVKAISVTGVGYNYEMAEAAKRAGIVFCALRGFNSKEVADHTAALIVSLVRGLKKFDRSVEERGEWKPLLCAGSIHRIEDLVVGVVGLGQIGQGVARRLQGFGAKVVAYDPYLPPKVAADMNVELIDFDTLLAVSDVITNHMNLTAENTGMFNRAAFEKMEKHPVFVNCARGGSVVEADLLEALDSGRISAAGLDVFLSEKPDLKGEYKPFLGRDNVIITPHAAFYSTTSERLAQELSVANIRYALSGETDKISVIVNGVKNVKK